MHGHADGACLIGHGAGDGLTDPPRGIGGELEALLPVELLDGSDEAQVAFLNQVEEEHATTGVALGQRHHESQVRLQQVVLGLLAVVRRPLELALALEVHAVALGIEQMWAYRPASMRSERSTSCSAFSRLTRPICLR